MQIDHPYWIAFGDIHDHTANIARIPGLAQAAGAIIVGDMTIRGGVPQAARVIEAVRAVNPRVLAQIGNMDQPLVQPWLDGKGQGIHARVVELAPGLALMGLGWSTYTPFATPSETSEAQMAQWLEAAQAGLQDFDQFILASHTPPHNTTTDRTGSGLHVGSISVRDFILRVQPALCVTGHIHESRGQDMLGDTPVINPGDLASGGYVRITWDGQNVGASLETV